MKQVKYGGPSGTGVSVEPAEGGVYETDENGVVEVPDHIAKALLEQEDVWQAVPKSDQKKGD